MSTPKTPGTDKPSIPDGEKPSSGIRVPGEQTCIDGDAKPKTPIRVPPMQSIDQPGGKSPGSDYQP